MATTAMACACQERRIAEKEAIGPRGVDRLLGEKTRGQDSPDPAYPVDSHHIQGVVIT